MRISVILLISFMILPLRASAQGGFGGRGGGGGRGGFGGGRGGGGGGEGRRPAASRTEMLPITDTELRGPMSSEDAQKLFGLGAEEVGKYGATRDSFMVATRSVRDTAEAKFSKFRDAENQGDKTAAGYFRDALKPLAKTLKAQQEKFDEQVKHLFTKDHAEEYKKYRKIQTDEEKKPVPVSSPTGGRRGQSG